MNKAIFGLVLGASVAATTFFTPRTASAQEYWVGYVPSEHIATVEPVYWNGRPHYYYNGYWMYREGARWRYYRSEPAYFQQWRYRYPNGRWHYWRR